jgi:hypothetical protein
MVPHYSGSRCNRFKFEIIDVFAMRLLEYDRMALGIFLVILPQKH